MRITSKIVPFLHTPSPQNRGATPLKRGLENPPSSKGVPSAEEARFAPVQGTDQVDVKLLIILTKTLRKDEELRVQQLIS